MSKLKKILKVLGVVLAICTVVGFIIDLIDHAQNKIQGHVQGFYERWIKRPMDFFCALAGLIVLSPVMGVTALLVGNKLGSPVLYNQERVGTGEKVFKNYKFRSMTNEKDANGELLLDDVRLTRFGRLLRSTSLDELPELLNILKGDMSIVGPRPLPPVYLPYYREEERCRHDVRPGLTGLAQANGRNSISWDEKFRYDAEYVKHITFWGDIKILLTTVYKVFKRADIGQGEEHPGNLYDVRADMVQDDEAVTL